MTESQLISANLSQVFTRDAPFKLCLSALKHSSPNSPSRTLSGPYTVCCSYLRSRTVD